MIEIGRTSRRELLHRAGMAIAWMSLPGLLSCSGDSGGAEEKNATIRCATCPMRVRYDENPGSFISRLWKWHTSWCPGWRSYLASLPADERKSIVERYR